MLGGKQVCSSPWNNQQLGQTIHLQTGSSLLPGLWFGTWLHYHGRYIFGKMWIRQVNNFLLHGLQPLWWWLRLCTEPVTSSSHQLLESPQRNWIFPGFYDGKVIFPQSHLSNDWGAATCCIHNPAVTYFNLGCVFEHCWTPTKSAPKWK